MLCGCALVSKFEKRGYVVADCDSCGHRQVQDLRRIDLDAHVESVYGDRYFKGDPAGYHDYVVNGSHLVDRGERYGRLLAKHCHPGRLLDVGAAAGFLLEGMEKVGWHCSGIEPNDAMAALGRERGLSISTGTAETAVLPDALDAITLIQVIGHFIDPVLVLRRCIESLRPGGVVLVESWNRSSVTARLFGANWHEYNPPSVLHWFSRSGLDALLASFGTRRVGHGHLIKRIARDEALSILSNSGGRLARGAAHLLPPMRTLPYPSEDLFWALYRRE